MARKPNPAFNKPWKPDAALAAVVGEKPLSRPKIVKKLWDYIKSNKLQDTKNRRAINCDAKLKGIFENKDQITMFEMNKMIGKHIS